MVTPRWEWRGNRFFEVTAHARCEVDFTGYACCLACRAARGSHVLVRADGPFFCLTCRNRAAMNDFRDWIVADFEASKKKRKEEP